jgi:prolipoprotein diacylglyceryltransferase
MRPGGRRRRAARRRRGPTLLVAQAIARIGNYFNQELFGRPTSLPWALLIDFNYGTEVTVNDEGFFTDPSQSNALILLGLALT